MSEQFIQDISKSIWESKYKAKTDSNILDTWNRVSSFVARAEKTDELQHDYSVKFYELLFNFKFLPGGRITANADPDKSKVTLFNCFLSSEIEDSLDSIMDVAKEAALVMQAGGGIGFSFSNIRPRGDIIHSSGAEASGPVSFMDIYNAVCGTIKSGNNRRGAMLGALSIEHPDIEEFINAKESVTFGEGRLSNFNLSIHVTDKFMKAVENDDFFELKFNGKVYRRVRARELWDKIMKHTYDVAEPGVQFIDTVKKLDNLYFLDNHKAQGSNPCVIKGTYILTKNGYKRVEEIKTGELIQTIHYTGYEPVEDIEKHKKVMTYEVEFSDGFKMYVTASHMFYVIDHEINKIKSVRLDQLQPGADVMFETPHFDMSILESVDLQDIELGKEYVIKNESINNKFMDNLYGKSKSFMLGVLNGLVEYFGLVNIFDADNKIDRSRIEFDSYDYTILRNIRLILLYFGIRSNIYSTPFDNGRTEYILSIEGNNLYRLSKLLNWISDDHKTKREEIKRFNKKDLFLYNIDQDDYVTIESIKPYKEAEVYDLFCKETDTWVTEGILNRGCGEQFLPYNGACNLGSMNLVKYINNPFEDDASFDFDSFSKDVKLAIRFLDNVIDLSNFPTDKYRKQVKIERRVGLGITGLADAFVMLKLKYGNHDETLSMLKKIMKVLRDSAYESSVELAKEKGCNDLLKSKENRDAFVNGKFVKRLPANIKDDIIKYGIRNTFLLSVAPVGTGSIYAGNVSSGIEPIFSNMYFRKVRQNDNSVKEEKVYDYAYLLWLEKYDTEKLPDYWVTTNDIDVEDHLAVLEIVQYYTGNSTSKTINVPSDYPFDKFKNVYTEAWKRGIKGVTTYRPNPKVSSVIEVKDDKDNSDNNKNKRLKRDPVLRGVTYKLKAPVDKFSYYITINNFNDEPRPFEIFINTRSNKQPIYSFISRLLSALFRKERNYDFILNEMENTFVNGEGFWYERRYVGSIIAGIGYIIRKHIEENKPGNKNTNSILTPKIINKSNSANINNDDNYEICPECGAPALRSDGGCKTCINCGYSACG